MIFEICMLQRVLALSTPNAASEAALSDRGVCFWLENQSDGFLSAAQSLGLELHVLEASTERDFDAVSSQT